MTRIHGRAALPGCSTRRRQREALRRRRRDHGSATVFAASIAMVLVVVASAAVTVVAVMLAGHRARSAADLAALAAATAQVSGLDPCNAARANARENSARISACRVSGEASSFVVAVTAVVDTGLGRPLPIEVGALARAGNAHDAHGE